MSTPLRKSAACAAAALAAALLTSTAAGSRAVADPVGGDGPTAQTLAPPPPRATPPTPRAAPAPPPAGSSTSSASDEAAIRQTVQASTNAYNAQDWGAFMGFVCAARQSSFPLQMIKNQRAQRGPMQTTVSAVTITANTAIAMTTMSDRISVTLPYHMVREGGWKVCN